MSTAASSRWSPTPEQLMILEELYKRGIRTPNASQIQRITGHLSLYGRIEGKNVFYWFQNHKARDRQKLRRKLIKQLEQEQLQYHSDLLQQNQSSSHLFNHLDHYATSGFQDQHSYHINSATLPPLMQQERHGAPTEMMVSKSAAKIPQREKPMTRMYDNDCMMMVDEGPLSPHWTRPLRTLELFPIPATNLEDESNVTSFN